MPTIDKADDGPENSDGVEEIRQDEVQVEERWIRRIIDMWAEV